MSNSSPLDREQIKKLARVHEEAAEVLMRKLKNSETESEKDVLFKQIHQQLGKAISYRQQDISIILTMAKADAKKLVSLMSGATKRLKKIEKVDDIVYYSGRILQAAVLLASAPAGGALVAIATIEALFGEADNDVGVS